MKLHNIVSSGDKSVIVGQERLENAFTPPKKKKRKPAKIKKGVYGVGLGMTNMSGGGDGGSTGGDGGGSGGCAGGAGGAG